MSRSAKTVLQEMHRAITNRFTSSNQNRINQLQAIESARLQELELERERNRQRLLDEMGHLTPNTNRNTEDNNVQHRLEEINNIQRPYQFGVINTIEIINSTQNDTSVIQIQDQNVPIPLATVGEMLVRHYAPTGGGPIRTVTAESRAMGDRLTLGNGDEWIDEWTPQSEAFNISEGVRLESSNDNIDWAPQQNFYPTIGVISSTYYGTNLINSGLVIPRTLDTHSDYVRMRAENERLKAELSKFTLGTTSISEQVMARNLNI